MKNIFLLCFFALGNSLFANNPDSYLSVKVKPGDALYSLLKNYFLDEYSCNVDAFYEINNMKNSDYLLANKTYKLPIKKYTYNGTSIRSTINNDNWDLAITIQNYNKLLRDKGIKTYYTDDNILYVPHHLLHCAPIEEATKNTTENKVKTISSDIYFGQNISLIHESNRLKNHVYYIISGHGGPDPGAMKTKNSHELCEDEYAYDVSIRLAKQLLENGASVHMIIQDLNDGIRDNTYLPLDKDEICKGEGAIPLNQLARLKQRVRAVNKLYKTEKNKPIHRVIAIHVDSRAKGLEQDVFFYHAPGSTTGKTIAENIQDTFRKKYEIYQKGRGYEGSVTARNLYVLRETHPPAVYVELANIQNTNNHKRILPPENRQALANWLYEGLTK